MELQYNDERWIQMARDWAIKAHADTNHMYGKIYPYALHLNWVASVGRRYIHLVPKDIQVYTLMTCYTHDVIEDARMTYNDVYKALGSDEVAEATFVLTNLRGRNRKERANEEYYKGIRLNRIARFVKLCDRIANMEFGKQFGGMIDMYRDELPEFLIGLHADAFYPEMAEYLRSL